jgi:hypothetical protein
MAVPVMPVVRTVAAGPATIEAPAAAIPATAIGTASTAAIPAAAERPLEARAGIAADARRLSRKFAL